jgi:uncharacterized protein with PQ loop repeat
MLTALSLLAMALTIGRAWPQVSHIAVHREVSGVSSSTWTLMLIHHVLWVVWGWGEEVLAVVVANSLAGFGALTVLVTLARHCEFRVKKSIASTIAVAMTGAWLMKADFETVVATITTIVTAAMVLPQVAQVFNEKIKGVSPGTWWMAVGSSITWTIYYVLAGKGEMTAPNFVIFPSAVVILAKVYSCRVNRRQGRESRANNAVGTSWKLNIAGQPVSRRS